MFDVRRSRRLRVSLLLIIGCVLFGGCSSSPEKSTSQPETPSRPNIIFMYSDDHTAQAVGAYREALRYGLKLNHSPTPNIDRLAEQGMRFDNAFVTNSICKPSRAVLLSGLHSHLNGVPTNGDQLDPNLLTFPKLLQDAGYQTSIFGKWHLTTTPQGFDHFEVLKGQGPYYNPRLKSPGGIKRYNGYTSDIITDRAVRWLKNKRDDDRPFMMIYNHKAPHRNWLPGPDHIDTYDDREIAEPDTLFYDYSGLAPPAETQNMEITTTMSWGWDLKLKNNPKTGEPVLSWKHLVNRNNLSKEQTRRLIDGYTDENETLTKNYEDWSRKKRTRWRYQRYIKDYLRSVRGIDDGVERLMTYLEENDLKENTIVIYSADQGFFLGENGWFDKRWIYEESLRLPLIVRWPAEIEPGSVDRHLVQNLDFAPTLLDLAGVEVPDRMQGRSLVPLMNGNDPDDWRDAIYYHYYEGRNGPHNVPRHYGIRTRRYTLAHYYRDDAWELFDLKTDPEQLNSVYGEPEYQEVQKRLKQKLNKLQEKYGDHHPTESTDVINKRQKRITNERREK